MLRIAGVDLLHQVHGKESKCSHLSVDIWPDETAAFFECAQTRTQGLIGNCELSISIGSFSKNHDHTALTVKSVAMINRPQVINESLQRTH